MALQWFVDEDNYLKNIKKYQDEKTLADETMKSQKAAFDRLALHDATLPATALYKEIKEAESTIAKQEDALKKIGDDIANKNSVIQQAEEALNRLKTQEANAPNELTKQKPHIDEARKIKGELKALKEYAEEKASAKEKCEKSYNRAQEAYRGSIELAGENLEECVRKAIDAFEAESKKIEGIDAPQLQKAKADANQRKNDLKDALRIQKDIAEKHNKQQENADSRITLDTRKKEIDENLAKLQIETLTSELQTLRDSHTLMTSKDWVQHRSRLRDGEACPLCGATEHPYKSESAWAPVVSDLKKLINEKEITLKNKREDKNRLVKEQGEIDGKLKGLETSDKSLDNDLDKLEAEWDQLHTKHPGWPSELSALEDLQPTIDQETKATSDALDNYNTSADNISKLRTIKETGTALNDAIKALSEAAGKVKEKDEALKNEIGDKDPDVHEQTLAKALKDATAAVNKGTNDIAEHKKALEGLNGQQKTTQDIISAAKKKLDDSTKSLAGWLKTYNGEHAQQLTTEDIAALCSATDDWEEIRRRQTQLNAEQIKAATTYSNELKAHGEHQGKKPSSTQEELAAKKTELEKNSYQELTDAKARVQNHNSAKEKMGELFDQRQAAGKLKNDWEEISKAIGGDGKTLRKIAQCYTLRFLIEHANAEIRKFNSRYELMQVKNSLGIRVIDHDRADDIRDTTSLSGGETFIVSLGLALGLSSLSSRNISFENLFIDEGFGTLDPDTLATVIDSLAMLQSSQGKKVGVISHTDTMTERITTQIRIIINGHSGSSHIEIHP